MLCSPHAAIDHREYFIYREGNEQNSSNYLMINNKLFNQVVKEGFGALEK